MIIDITGIELTPGNGGADCAGNGKHFDQNGIRMECCCEECSYFMCCVNKEQDQLEIRNIRRIDELGTIVIPLNIRENLNWKCRTKINIICTVDCITLMESNEGHCVMDRFGRIKIPEHILETAKISIDTNIELIHSSNRVHLYRI